MKQCIRPSILYCLLYIYFILKYLNTILKDCNQFIKVSPNNPHLIC